jgi:hypothetical protein
MIGDMAEKGTDGRLYKGQSCAAVSYKSSLEFHFRSLFSILLS